MVDSGPPLRAASHRYMALQEPFEESTIDLFRRGTGSGPIFLLAGGEAAAGKGTFVTSAGAGGLGGQAASGAAGRGPRLRCAHPASFRPSMHPAMNVGVFSRH